MGHTHLGQRAGSLEPDLVIEARGEDGVLEAVAGEDGGVLLQCLQGMELGGGISLVAQHVLPCRVRLLCAESANPLVVRVHTDPQDWHLVAMEATKIWLYRCTEIKNTGY